MEKINMHKIPIVLSSDENYSRYMYVTILSILENKNDDTFCDFYLLVPNEFSSFINKEFYKLQERYTNCAINFVEMDSDFTKLKMSISHITYPTYYRLKMAELLPQYDKVIYLDTDVIVKKDLSEYYNIDLNNNYVGGVCAIGYAINWDKNIKAYESYGINNLKDLVNAGVTLWNLKKIREENLTQQLMSMIPNNYGGQDQDIINIAFHKNIKFVPLKFNLMTKYPQLTDKTHKDYCLLKEVFGEDNIEEALKSPVIIHYADRVKPWKNSRSWLAFKWWEYAKKSPFFINFIINRYICVEKRADRIIFNFFGIKLKIKRNFHENDKV